VGSEPPPVAQSQSELEEFFDLALDLMVIVGFDGYFKRVNRAYERTLGYPLRDLLSRPFLEFVHPEDRPSVRDLVGELAGGDRTDVTGFESRAFCRDGSVRWLQWNSRTLPERGVIFAVGRDVTDRRRDDAELREAHRMVEASRAGLARLAEEQAALRRIATLVARGQPPEEVFAAVAREVERLLDAEMTNLARYDPDGAFTVVASSGIGLLAVGSRWPVGGKNLATLVFETAGPARLDNYVEASGAHIDGARPVGLRSSVGVPIILEGRLWGIIGVATTQAEPLPADTEARLSSFTELVATAIANAESHAALAASRARIVAAADETRRRIERDLHDGAQQRLVHTVIVQKLALRALHNGDANVGKLMTEALQHAEQANSELSELAHGILPSVLTREGLRAGIQAIVSRISLPVSVDMAVERLPAGVEATAYFVVSEALTNVVKHARADGAAVTARVDRGVLRIEIRDDGIGGAHAGDSSGLRGLEDRVSALDGRLVVESHPGGGTHVCALLPVSQPG